MLVVNLSGNLFTSRIITDSVIYSVKSIWLIKVFFLFFLWGRPFSPQDYKFKSRIRELEKFSHFEFISIPFQIIRTGNMKIAGNRTFTILKIAENRHSAILKTAENGIFIKLILQNPFILYTFAAINYYKT